MTIFESENRPTAPSPRAAPPGHTFRGRAIHESARGAARPAVLVADDIPAVCLVLTAIVTAHGYNPHPAGSGPEALDVYRANCGVIAAAVLDVQMPDMDGPATLLALREITPDLPCVFVSDNSGYYSVAELLALGSVAVLSKPDLLQPLGRALAAAIR